MCLCPFHNERRPSFKVYPDTNSFYCYGCGASGSIIDFVARYHGVKPLEAAKIIDCNFRLGLADGRVPEEQRREYAEKKAARDNNKRLVNDYMEWESKYYLYLCDSLYLYDKLLEASKPKSMDDDFTEDFVMATNRKQIIEYHLDILDKGEIDEKVSLYIEKRGAVTL
jgi:hypothetical protein